MKFVGHSRIAGEVKAPPSKSAMIRAVIASAMAEGNSVIKNASRCDDALMALSLIKEFGVDVDDRWSEVEVSGGVFDPQWHELDCGESGLLMRIMAPLIAINDKEFQLIGQGTLLNRPMSMLEAPLRELGVKCETAGGVPPVTIQGPMKGGEITIDGSATSQFLSGLLMSLPLCEEDSVVTVNDLQSKPYVRMTKWVLKRFNVSIEGNVDKGVLRIRGGQSYTPASMKIPGDWSGAAFLLVGGAISGEVSVNGLNVKSNQADREIVQALRSAGADVKVEDRTVTARKAPLKGFTFDATDCPDLFPPLVVLALNCEGETRITGVDRIRTKESDRAVALMAEFGKFGAQIEVRDNVMVVTGSQLSGGDGDPSGDHRIAMALATAALTSKDGISIEDDDCVTKSYPNFFRDLESLVVRE